MHTILIDEITQKVSYTNIGLISTERIVNMYWIQRHHEAWQERPAADAEQNQARRAGQKNAHQKCYFGI